MGVKQREADSCNSSWGSSFIRPRSTNAGFVDLKSVMDVNGRAMYNEGHKMNEKDRAV